MGEKLCEIAKLFFTISVQINQVFIRNFLKSHPYNSLNIIRDVLLVKQNKRGEILIKNISQVNRYGYPYFHRNCAEYGRLRSEIAHKRTVFTRNIGHSNTTPYTCRNLIMIGPYFCARYYGCIRSVYAS